MASADSSPVRALASCTVTTGARLHFGPLAWRPSHGRSFGGWGVMVEAPACIVRLSTSVALDDREAAAYPGSFRDAGRAGAEGSSTIVRTTITECLAAEDSEAANNEAQERAREVLDRCLSQRQTSNLTAPINVECLASPPAHAGLGSGTQLALAIARGVETLCGGPDVPSVDLARRTGRGRRSAVGIHGFALGGLIVDAGHLADEDIGALAARLPVPTDWRFVLCRPLGATGLRGAEERHAFRQLAPYPEGLSERLSRILLCDALPAVQSGDFPAFAAALGVYGALVGAAFEPAQGGPVHPQSRSLWRRLEEWNISGVAQSSWGPTLAVPCPTDAAAQQLVDRLNREPPPGPAMQVLVSRVRDRGADAALAPAR